MKTLNISEKLSECIKNDAPILEQNYIVFLRGKIIHAVGFDTSLEVLHFLVEMHRPWNIRSDSTSDKFISMPKSEYGFLDINVYDMYQECEITDRFLPVYKDDKMDIPHE